MTRYALAAAGIVLAAFALFHSAPHAPQQAAGQPDRPQAGHRARVARFAAPSPSPATVYVAGAVARPGLYGLPAGARAAAAIASAGGFVPGADPEGVNLAARVSDGEEIAVPRLGEAHRTVHARAPRRQAPIPAEASVDVNAAQADEIAKVPGIGRALAQRIVELRERDGAFASLDELLDVAGMTSARLERARPFLRQP